MLQQCQGESEPVSGGAVVVVQRLLRTDIRYKIGCFVEQQEGEVPMIRLKHE